MNEISPDHKFQIQVGDDVLDDLRRRLQQTRWPAVAKGAPWALGTSLPYMKKVHTYWLERYDWRRWEAKLNQFTHYRVPVDGQDIHVVIEKGSGAHPLPLILASGWPGSFAEYIDVIEPLAHPERFGGNVDDAFTVIVPSMPGYGFSPPPEGPISPQRIAQTWIKLARDVLGLSGYGAHGSDWGAGVTSWMAYEMPPALRAIHLTMPILSAPPSSDDRPLDDEERAYRDRLTKKLATEAGYQAIQGTKPQTLSFGLTDSPIGLASWILEKFHGWTGSAGHDQEPPFNLDHLLTNIMIYWLNGINASTWLYRFLFDGTGFRLPPGKRIELPTGLCLFPDDIAPVAPAQWQSRFYNVVHRTVSETGGHFPALETGVFLVEDLRRFFREYR